MADLLGGITHAAIDASSSGNNTIIAAASGKKIFVYRMWFLARAPVDVKVRDGTSTDLTGPLPFNNTVGFWMDYSVEPWFQTSSGNAFVLNLSAAIQVSGQVSYKLLG